MGVLRNCAGLFAVAAALVASPVAHAALSLEPAVAPVVNVAVGDASGPPLGQATPTLTFTFPEEYVFTSMLLYVDYDPLKMSFDNVASTARFNPTGLPSFTLDEVAAALAGELSIVEDTTPGAYSLFATFATQSYTLPAGSSLVLTGIFTLDALPPGQSTNVEMSGILTSIVADADPSAVNNFGNLFGKLPNQVPGTALIATVTAVPEPETWLMLLGGLGLLASRMRRRTR